MERLVSFGVSEQVFEVLRDMAGWCNLITHVDSAWLQRLQLQYDTLLSRVAFNFSLGPCNTGRGGGTRLPANERDPVVGRCRLTLSNPR